MNLKSVSFSVGFQVLPSILALWFFYQVPKDIASTDTYLPFYIVGAIALVKFISDFGLSRSFTKIYAETGFCNRILSAFLKLYLLISALIFIVSLPIVLWVNTSYISISISLCVVGLSMYLDNVLIAQDKLHYLYLIDSIFFSLFYGAALILIDQSDPLYLTSVFLVLALGQFYLKLNLSQLNLLSLYMLTSALKDEEKTEFKYSLMSSFSIAGYKQTDRALVMYFFSPMLYSFYQVANQLVNKVMLFPQLIARQMLVKFSQKQNNGSNHLSNCLSSVYMITEAYNIAFLLILFLLSNKFLQLLDYRDPSASNTLIWIGISAVYATSARYIRAYIIGTFGGGSLVQVDFKAGLLAILLGLSILSLNLPVHFYLLAVISYYLYIYCLSWHFLLKKHESEVRDRLLLCAFEAAKLITIIIYG